MTGKIPFAVLKVRHFGFFSRVWRYGSPYPSAIFITTMWIATRERENHVKIKNNSSVPDSQERLNFI